MINNIFEKINKDIYDLQKKNYNNIDDIILIALIILIIIIYISKKE
jgi:hypothetical protein